MAQIILHKEKLRFNYEFLDRAFKERGIQWAVVSKLLCGSEAYIQYLLDLGLRMFCDSRLANLQTIKRLCPDAQTLYIKPVPQHAIPDIIAVATCTFNTELETIRMLNEEAVKQDKVHEVILMLEVGERREGVLPEDIVEVARLCRELSNIRLVGLGANLTCMYGVLPSEDNLMRLQEAREAIQEELHMHIPILTGGSSVVLPLLLDNTLPEPINHFRIGESLFFGTDVYHGGILPQMMQDVFELRTRIIELAEKQLVPEGELGMNMEGKTLEFDDEEKDKTSWRALVDVGLLDLDIEAARLKDERYEVTGASSDMLVIDLGDNPEDLKVGDSIFFRLNYLSALRLMNSYYIEKTLA